jgi:hypothetical protein
MKLRTFGLSEFSIEEEVVTIEELQRTEEWRKKRSGCWTGSKNSKLMGCGRATAKMQWGSVEKTVDFGVTAERHIYAVGQERITGLRSQKITSQELRYGNEQEPFFKAQLIKDGIFSNFEDLGFEYFGNYKLGGASSDGRAIYTGKKYPELHAKTIGIEMKCCVSWDGHYNRMYEVVNEKHDDFWQHQSEMLAMEVEDLLYCVAMPMQTKLYDEQLVKASKVHQKALLDRCMIADEAIKLWPIHGYKEALNIACANFESINQ